MTIYTVQFDYSDQDMYASLLKAFKNSVQLFMPGVNFVEKRLASPGKKIKKKHSLLSNTLKLREWKKWMDETDEPTVFMDCDMMLLQPISSAFDEDFDVGYTIRTSAQIPVNGGVVFAKPTEGARQFFTAWLDINEQMYKNPGFHIPYRNKYAGMNQAAFGYLLEHPLPNTTLATFSCAEWNSCSEDWRYVDSHTRVVHVKSVLRKMCFDQRQKPRVPCYKILVDIWNSFLDGKNPTHLIKNLSKNDDLNRNRLEMIVKKTNQTLTHTPAGLTYIRGDAIKHKTGLEKQLKNYHDTTTSAKKSYSAIRGSK
jgi:hypothetical protein